MPAVNEISKFNQAKMFVANRLIQSIKKSIPNLDPTFFYGMISGNTLTTQDIEKEPYANHAWVFACAYVIAKNISRLPKVMYHQDSPQETTNEHEVLDVLNQPNQFMDGDDFIFANVLNLLLNTRSRSQQQDRGGQSFIIPTGSSLHDKVDLRRGQIPTRLVPYNDENIFPVTTKVGQTGKLIAWMLRINGVEVERYLDEQLIRIRQYNPYNWLRGISNYQPAKTAIQDDIVSTVWNSRLFQNNGMSSAWLKTDAKLTKEQKREMIKAYYEMNGGPNANSVFVADKGIDYKHIGLSPVDMQYTELKKDAIERTIMDFGVNLIALGKYEDINLATIREGRKMLWQDTYMPLAQRITAGLNHQWVQFIEKGLRIRFDFSDIEALRPDYLTRARSGAMMVDKMFIPAIEAAKINGIPLPEDALELYPWLAENPADLKKKGTAAPQTTEGEGDNGEASYIRDKFWSGYVKTVLVPGEMEYRERYSRYFYAQRNRLQDRLDLLGKKKKDIGVSEVLIDLDKENELILQMNRGLIKNQLERSKNRIESLLDKDIQVTVDDDVVGRVIGRRSDALKSINQETFDLIGQKIGDAIRDNDYPDTKGMVKDLKKLVGRIYEVRLSQVIKISKIECSGVSIINA